MKCYIYGAGCMYNRIMGRVHLSADVNVMGVITTDPPVSRTLDGYQRMRADDADWHDVDYVIIAVEDWKPIFSIITEYGVPDEKILNGKVFELPYFNLRDYLQLKSSRPSIVSNTCLGGRVYKELGLEMHTPCINAVCLDDKQYIDFLKDFKTLTDRDIVPIKQDERISYPGTYNREFFMPQGDLGGKIKWCFPHEDIDIALSNWNRRRKKINYENISCLMIPFSDEGAFEFDQLEVERKLGFYYKDLGLKSVVYTPEWNDPDVQRSYDFNYVMFVHRYATNVEGKGRVNWIDFLRGSNTYLRW